MGNNTGEAVLDQLATTSTLTVQASDNPHGVVQFQPSSVTVSSDETVAVSLTLIRAFGTIGGFTISDAEWHGSLDPCSQEPSG